MAAFINYSLFHEVKWYNSGLHKKKIPIANTMNTAGNHLELIAGSVITLY